MTEPARVCSKCHNLLSACLICGEPAHCGDVICTEHTPEDSYL